MADVDDPRLEELIDLYGSKADEIAGLLTEMAMTPRDDMKRAELLAVILSLLADLRGQTEDWADEAARSIFEEADLAAQDSLDELGLLEYSDWDEDYEAEIAAIVDEHRGNLDKALASIQVLATRLRSGSVPTDLVSGTDKMALLLGGIAVSSLVEIRSRIRENMRNAAVGIVGADAQVHRFSLDYYAAVVANQMMQDAISRATIQRSLDNDQDLVQVSPNPSTIGDYCDEYRGKVFSISGMDAHYPPLSSIPNGGCPMHPHCHHSLMPFSGIDEFGEVNPDFLELAGKDGVGPNDFQSLWRSKK